MIEYLLRLFGDAGERCEELCDRGAVLKVSEQRVNRYTAVPGTSTRRSTSLDGVSPHRIPPRWPTTHPRLAQMPG